MRNVIYELCTGLVGDESARAPIEIVEKASRKCRDDWRPGAVRADRYNGALARRLRGSRIAQRQKFELSNETIELEDRSPRKNDSRIRGRECCVSIGRRHATSQAITYSSCTSSIFFFFFFVFVHAATIGARGLTLRPRSRVIAAGVVCAGWWGKPIDRDRSINQSRLRAYNSRGESMTCFVNDFAVELTYRTTRCNHSVFGLIGFKIIRLS